MKFSTVGREFLKGYRMNMYCGEKGALDPDAGYMEAFRVILVEAGSGVIRIGDRRSAFVAPVVFCFNEQDVFKIEKCGNCRAQAMWFHPDIINISFDFERIRKKDHELTYTEIQDIFWMNVFCRRREDFCGQLNIGPGQSKRIRELFNSISLELVRQPDSYWPCRCRTYAIELLFLLSRLVNQPQSVEYIMLQEDEGDVGDVVQYLHSRFSEKITLEDLTGKFHINRTTLSRNFFEATGSSIMAYLLKLRLYLASQMLKDTLLPVVEVYERVGFNDASHFGRLFRKYYGHSPTEYRKLNNWMV